MSESVVIKGNKYGLNILLDENISFDELKLHVAHKFRKAATFFEGVNMTVTFEGRTLTFVEEKELVDTISDNSNIEIICLLDGDKTHEEYHRKELAEQLALIEDKKGVFYKGTLSYGQVLESEKSIIIIGDVMSGAKIISSGNVVVIGSLEGTVYAGVTGNEDSHIIALEMNPIQIRIGDILTKSFKRQRNIYETYAKIAFVENDNICMETL